MRQLSFILILILIQGCTTIQSVSVEEQGIYSYQKRGALEVDEIATGKLVKATEVVLVKETDQIPHKKGIQFGVGFIIHGTPVGQSIPVTIRFKHPPINNPKTGQVTEITEWKTHYEIGSLHCFGHGYDEEGSMPPGKYEIQLIYKGKMMFERNFYVQ